MNPPNTLCWGQGSLEKQGRTAKRCQFEKGNVKGFLTHYTRVLLQKMKKGLSILCRDPQGGEEFSHSGPKLFVMVIDRCGMVQFGLWLGSLGSGQ